MAKRSLVLLSILSRAVGFLLIIYLGYFLKHRQVFRREDGAKLSVILMNVTLPCSILSSEHQLTFTSQLLIPFFLGMLGNLLLDGIGYYFEKSHEPEAKAIALIQSSGFNIGTFVLPFVMAFFPSRYIMTVLLFDIGNSIMCIRGNYLMAERIIGGQQKESLLALAKKVFASIPLCTYLLVLVISLLHISIPQGILNFTSIAGNANPFLAMFMIGVMVDFHIEKSAAASLVRRLLQRFGFMAVLSALLYLFLPVNLAAKQMMVLCLFAPISTLGPVYAMQLGSKSAEPANLNSLSIFVSIIILTILCLCFI